MVDEGLEIDKKMMEAVAQCDIVVTSGGVSMGMKDLIKPYIEKKGQVIFGRLNMKPGKPTTFGKIKDTLVFSLPGNPVSCFVTFNLLVLPSIKILSG
jgi:molybdenum cofactor synthesis domain-containing protein